MLEVALAACGPSGAGFASENGFQSGDKSFQAGHTFSNNGETWIEAGPLSSLPSRAPPVSHACLCSGRHPGGATCRTSTGRCD